MAQNTGISWCDDTFNVVWGCTPHGPGCLNCYAEAQAKRYGYDIWGAKAPRRMFGAAHSKMLDGYQQLAITGDPESGAPALRSRRVFVGSMMDFAEERADTAPLMRAFLASAASYTGLDFLLVTKRPENYQQILADVFTDGKLPQNIWLGCTAVNQAEINRFAPLLADTARRWGAAAAFLSIEPQLESVRVPPEALGNGGITWLITGGESGNGSRIRPYRPEWAAEIIEQARAAGIAPFVKQFGNIAAKEMGLRGKGDEPATWPAELAVQEFPLPRRVLVATAPVKASRKGRTLPMALL